MPTSKEYLEFIKEQLSTSNEVDFKSMMGEYLVYYKGKLVGGIYDDRFLVKPIKTAIDYMTDIKYELPYDGAKPMLLVDNLDRGEYIIGLFEAMYPQLPLPKKRK